MYFNYLHWWDYQSRFFNFIIICILANLLPENMNSVSTVPEGQWGCIVKHPEKVLCDAAGLIWIVTFKCHFSDSGRGSVLWSPRQWYVWWRKSEIHCFQSIKKLHTYRICSKPLSNNGEFSVAEYLYVFILLHCGCFIALIFSAYRQQS